MSEYASPESRAELHGRAATDWFRRTYPQDAGRLFDWALTAIDRSFGPNAELSIRAHVPGDERSTQGELFVAVLGSVANDATWSQFVQAHRAMLSLERGSLGETPARAAAEHFHLVIDDEPDAFLPWPRAFQEWIRP
jgi:hypothetical protein